MSKIPWDKRPKQADACYPVQRIKAGQPRVVVLLEPPKWVRLHWADGKTYPCPRRTGKKCQNLHHCWKGYASAIVAGFNEEGKQKWLRCVMEVPHESELLELVIGKPLKFSRTAHKPIGKLTCEKLDDWKVDLPKPFSVEASLARLWGIT